MKDRIREQRVWGRRRGPAWGAPEAFLAALLVLSPLSGLPSPAVAVAQTTMVQSSGPRASSQDEEAELKKKWKALPRQQQEEYRRRLKKFQNLPPKEKELYQRRYKQLRKLTPQERQRLNQELDSWDRLSPEEKKRIRQKFINRLILPPERSGKKSSG